MVQTHLLKYWLKNLICNKVLMLGKTPLAGPLFSHKWSFRKERFGVFKLVSLSWAGNSSLCIFQGTCSNIKIISLWNWIYKRKKFPYFARGENKFPPLEKASVPNGSMQTKNKLKLVHTINYYVRWFEFYFWVFWMYEFINMTIYCKLIFNIMDKMKSWFAWRYFNKQRETSGMFIKKYICKFFEKSKM